MGSDSGIPWIYTNQATIVAIVFSSISIFISAVHITQHLMHYTMPGIQIYVIRILAICPVYALSSALALNLGANGFYAEIVRDIYEAFVIYSFLNLVLEYCGGETDCIHQIENDPVLRMPFPLCFLKPMPRDARLMRFCHRGVLQFIITKPFFAIIDVIMISTGNYFHPVYQWFEMSIYNISYTWALFCLYVFYLATKKLIKNFRPILKFVTVKAIVFATYYQSIGIKAAPLSAEEGYMWNDMILCLEMVLFALMLHLAFPISEFKGGIKDSVFFDNVKDVLTVKDVVQDVYHNFMPTYQNYALQRSEHEAMEMLRSRSQLSGNLDSVALEMSKRYRGRNKRLSFNALLRGDKPIRAVLRRNKYRTEHHHHNDQDPHSGEGRKRDTSVDSSGCQSDDSASISESCDSRHGLMSPRRGSIVNGNVINNTPSGALGSDTKSFQYPSPYTWEFANGACSTPRSAGSGDSGGSHSSIRNPMLPCTHGIGIIVSEKGVSMREWNSFPTEEDRLVNLEFMSTSKESLLDHHALDIESDGGDYHNGNQSNSSSSDNSNVTDSFESEADSNSHNNNNNNNNNNNIERSGRAHKRNISISKGNVDINGNESRSPTKTTGNHHRTPRNKIISPSSHHSNSDNISNRSSPATRDSSNSDVGVVDSPTTPTTPTAIESLPSMKLNNAKIKAIFQSQHKRIKSLESERRDTRLVVEEIGRLSGKGKSNRGLRALSVTSPTTSPNSSFDNMKLLLEKHLMVTKQKENKSKNDTKNSNIDINNDKNNTVEKNNDNNDNNDSNDDNPKNTSMEDNEKRKERKSHNNIDHNNNNKSSYNNNSNDHNIIDNNASTNKLSSSGNYLSPTLIEGEKHDMNPDIITNSFQQDKDRFLQDDDGGSGGEGDGEGNNVVYDVGKLDEEAEDYFEIPLCKESNNITYEATEVIEEENNNKENANINIENSSYHPSNNNDSNNCNNNTDANSATNSNSDWSSFVSTTTTSFIPHHVDTLPSPSSSHYRIDVIDDSVSILDTSFLVEEEEGEVEVDETPKRRGNRRELVLEGSPLCLLDISGVSEEESEEIDDEEVEEECNSNQLDGSNHCQLTLVDSVDHQLDVEILEEFPSGSLLSDSMNGWQNDVETKDIGSYPCSSSSNETDQKNVAIPYNYYETTTATTATMEESLEDTIITTVLDQPTIDTSTVVATPAININKLICDHKIIDCPIEEIVTGEESTQDIIEEVEATKTVHQGDIVFVEVDSKVSNNVEVDDNSNIIMNRLLALQYESLDNNNNNNNNNNNMITNNVISEEVKEVKEQEVDEIELEGR